MADHFFCQCWFFLSVCESLHAWPTSSHFLLLFLVLLCHGAFAFFPPHTRTIASPLAVRRAVRPRARFWMLCAATCSLFISLFFTLGAPMGDSAATTATFPLCSVAGRVSVLTSLDGHLRLGTVLVVLGAFVVDVIAIFVDDATT